ncbi:MAG: UDP-N-acetylmuramoyl-L-alanine--D-glutamate ligase [Eubacteriales bacterium]|nr:UDP-N-acetylmuramoyl-L-alanine--D-glutamate ligase [Eubacteriales bacterium]
MNESRKIFIAGTGKSGISAAHLVLKLGGEVMLYNSNPDTDVEAVLKNFDDSQSVELVTGSLFQGHLRGVAICVLSPGISINADFVETINKAGVPVMGELEFASQILKGKIVGITGTNGKTTTTALTGLLMGKKYQDVKVAGNIGLPLSDVANLTTEESVSVIEVSSFMLETISTFKPHVSAITNITPDHLDRHGSMANYIAVKEDITMNQTEDDYVVLNYEDDVLRGFGESRNLKPHVVWFSSQNEPDGDSLFLRDGVICLKEDGIVTELISTRELKIIGKHNYENAMTAAACAWKMGVPLEAIREGLGEFTAVPHRIEFVRERCGVRYYNDSKGTNTDAAIQALNAMPGPTVLIGGGYDKGSEFDDWVKLFNGKVKQLILLGDTRNKIFETCRKYGFSNITMVDDMNEAVITAASYADEGEYVLLSPACASWDMYKSFEHRGDHFKKLVMEL